jgi:hypothetical protein
MVENYDETFTDQTSKELQQEVNERQNEITKELSKDITYLNAEEFKDRIDFYKKGMFQSINETLRTCMTNVTQNEKREKQQDLHSEIYLTDPWREMYFREKSALYYFIESVLPYYEMMRSTDEDMETKFIEIIKSYKSVADTKAELEFKEKIIAKMDERTERETLASRKMIDENYNRLEKFLKEQADNNKAIQKENLEYLKSAMKESLAAIERNYVNVREVDIKMLQQVLKELKDQSTQKGRFVDYNRITDDEKRKSKEDKQQNYSVETESGTIIESPVPIAKDIQKTSIAIPLAVQPVATTQAPAVPSVQTSTPEDLILQLFGKNKNLSPGEVKELLKKNYGVELPLSIISIKINMLKAQKLI